MRLQQYIFKSIFALSLSSLPVLWGCYDYTNEIPEYWYPEDQQPQEFQLRIKLTDGSRHATRAVPQGGEEGDGREFGQHYENDVKSVLLYYYNGSIDGSDATPVRRIIYHSGIDFHPTGSMSTVEVEKEAVVKFTYNETHYKYTSGDNFIAVINTPDFTVSTLGKLRDKLVNEAWKDNGGDKGGFTDFVMSNERVSEFTPGAGTEASPHKIDVTVERVAARLDYCTDNSTPTTFDGDPALEYIVKDKNAGGVDVTIGTMYLTHVRPFNVMEEPAYLLKRSATPAASTTFTFLATENSYNGTGFSSFPIVTEPHTWEKDDNLSTDHSDWYGESYLPKIRTSFGQEGDDWFTDDYKVHNNTSNDGFSSDGISDNATDKYTDDPVSYYVVDYANENTQQAGASLSNTATGFYLRGIFVPSPTRIFDTAADANAEPQIPSVTFAEGSTFYRYRPMVTEYDETQAVYFTDETEADKFGKSHPVPYVIDTYTNGLCYYPVYLRHDNPGRYTGTTGSGTTDKYVVTPMEYGIVRNNIYRLKVTFSGPGYNEIPTTPNLEPLGIKPYIFVRKWYQITHPEIEI